MPSNKKDSSSCLTGLESYKFTAFIKELRMYYEGALYIYAVGTVYYEILARL